MPKSTQIDWDLAKSLYQQGLPFVTVAQRLNCNASTIRSRAFREKWNVTVAKTAEIMKQSPVVTVKQKQEEWVGDAIDVCSGVIKHLKSLKPGAHKPKDLQLLMQTLKIVDDVARRSLNLDDPALKAPFNVAMTMNVTEVFLPEPATEAHPIDIASSTPPTEMPGLGNTA